MLLRRRRRDIDGEEGQVLPVLLTAIIAILAVTMLLLQVGRAGLLSTRTQTAADAAALAAMEAIEDAWMGPLASGTLPFYSGADYEDIARDAAADYAQRNGAELVDFEYTGGFGQHAVTVTTRSAEAQGGDLEGVADERPEATSHASLTAPNCDVTPGLRNLPGYEEPVGVQLLYCDGEVATWWTGDFAGDLTDDVAPYFKEPTLEPERPEVRLGPIVFAGNLAHALGAPISREEIVARARTWLTAYGGGPVPYSMTGYYPGPGGQEYRTDCSGFVSMAWGLETSLTTTTLEGVADPITQDELKPGDILLNSEGAGAGSHVILFLGWTDDSHSSYIGIEQRGGDGTVETNGVPYGYFSEPTEYRPYRYNNIKGE